jgi:hypothetical protein
MCDLTPDPALDVASLRRLRAAVEESEAYHASHGRSASPGQAAASAALVACCTVTLAHVGTESDRSLARNRSGLGGSRPAGATA